MPYKKSNWRTDVTVYPAVGPVIKLGLCDHWEGGDGDSDGSSYWRATGEQQLGGQKTRGEGTSTYLYDEAMHAVFERVDDTSGRGSAVIVRTPTNDAGDPFPGKAITITGQVKGVSMPEGEYGNNDGATVEITFRLNANLS